LAANGKQATIISFKVVIIFQEVVTEEVICPKLQELLFFMHSFLTAKVNSGQLKATFMWILFLLKLTFQNMFSCYRWLRWILPSYLLDIRPRTIGLFIS
jgi:hypothetical protein